MPTTNPLEQALDQFVDVLQTAQRDRALPLVHSLCVDFPAAKNFIFMKPEKMVSFCKLFFPAIAKKIEGQEDAIIEKLYDVQSRLRAMEQG